MFPLQVASVSVPPLSLATFSPDPRHSRLKKPFSQSLAGWTFPLHCPFNFLRGHDPLPTVLIPPAYVHLIRLEAVLVQVPADRCEVSRPGVVVRGQKPIRLRYMVKDVTGRNQFVKTKWRHRLFSSQ